MAHLLDSMSARDGKGYSPTCVGPIAVSSAPTLALGWWAQVSELVADVPLEQRLLTPLEGHRRPPPEVCNSSGSSGRRGAPAWGAGQGGSAGNCDQAHGCGDGAVSEIQGREQGDVSSSQPSDRPRIPSRGSKIILAGLSPGANDNSGFPHSRAGLPVELKRSEAVRDRGGRARIQRGDSFSKSRDAQLHVGTCPCPPTQAAMRIRAHSTICRSLSTIGMSRVLSQSQTC